MSKPLKHAQLPDEAVAIIAARFRLLGEPLRLKLLMQLEEGEKNVTELVQALGANQANVSRHLKALAAAGLLARRKQGASVFYSIADPMIFTLCEQVCGSLRKQLATQAQVAKLLEL